MINHEFIRFAHRRAVWAELQRLLMDRYVAQDKPPAAEIICEEVPFAMKEVKQDVLMEMLDELEELQDAERKQMMQFEMKRKSNGRRAKEQPEEEERPDGDSEAAVEPGEAGAREAVAAGSPGGAAG